MAGRYSVEAVFKAVDRMSAPVNRMQNRIGKFTRSAERNMKSLQRVTGRLTRGIKSAAGRIAKFGAAIGIALGIATYAALKKTADAADALAKQSRRLQFPIEQLQEWKFVAEQSGIANEKLDSSIGAFTKRLGEASAGIGPLVTGLKKVNPELLDQLLAADNVADAMLMYINAIRETKKATEKAALANYAFGRSGLDMVNIADNSAEAIKALMIEQRQNGNITMEQAMAAEAYNDAMNSLKKAMTGFMQGVMLPMLPMITATVRGWRDWILANKDFLKQGIEKVFSQIVDNVKQFVAWVKKLDAEQSIFDRIGNALKAILGFMAFLAKHGKTIAIIVGGIVALNAVLGLFIGIMTAVNLVMALNPIGLIVIGVAALVLGFTALYKWAGSVEGAFRKWAGAMDYVLDRINPVYMLIKKVIEGIKFVANADINPFNNRQESSQRERGAVRPQVVSPTAGIERKISESTTTNKSEVTIKDQTGKAELTKRGGGARLSLQPSGAF